MQRAGGTLTPAAHWTADAHPSAHYVRSARRLPGPGPFQHRTGQIDGRGGQSSKANLAADEPGPVRSRATIRSRQPPPAAGRADARLPDRQIERLASACRRDARSLTTIPQLIVSGKVTVPTGGYQLALRMGQVAESYPVQVTVYLDASSAERRRPPRRSKPVRCADRGAARSGSGRSLSAAAAACLLGSPISEPRISC